MEDVCSGMVIVVIPLPEKAPDSIFFTPFGTVKSLISLLLLNAPEPMVSALFAIAIELFPGGQ